MSSYAAGKVTLRVFLDARHVYGTELSMSIPSRFVALKEILHSITMTAGLVPGWEKSALILINGRPSHHTGGLESVVKDGDLITVVRPMGGG